MKEREALLKRAAEHTIRYLENVDQRPVRASATSQELYERLSDAFRQGGEDPSSVIDAIAEAAKNGTAATQGGRFFGFVVGGSLPVSTATDWLVSGWDQNAAIYVLSPLAAVIERIAAEWILQITGLPATWSVGYVTGGSMANFTSLAAARRHALAEEGWDVEADGLFGAPPIDVVVSEEAHYTIRTSLRMLGLGGERVRRIAVDAQGRMRPDALADALRDTSGPCIVCTQIGNVNTGAFDPIDEIADVTAERGAWLHVDGAFGLWASGSSSYKHLVRGIERADSVATDAHKWLNVPYDCGIVLCAHPESHRGAMTLAAAYIEDTPLERDPRGFTPEESRRARAVPVYAVLRTLGPSGLADLIERCCRHARRFAEALEGAGHEILNDVVLNQVLVSFGDADTTRRVISAIQSDGTCWCGGTKWKGRAAMRISVSSWATTDDDVELSIEAMLRAATSTSESNP